MTTPSRPDHRALAEALRRRVLDGPGETDPALRKATAERAAGGPAVRAPYDDLAREIGESATRVTDEQVASILRATGARRPHLKSSRLRRWAPASSDGEKGSRHWMRSPMRLHEIERGDGVFNRLLIRLHLVSFENAAARCGTRRLLPQRVFCYSDGRVDAGGNAWTKYVEHRRA